MEDSGRADLDYVYKVVDLSSAQALRRSTCRTLPDITYPNEYYHLIKEIIENVQIRIRLSFHATVTTTSGWQLQIPSPESWRAPGRLR